MLQINNINYFNNKNITTNNALKDKEKLFITSKYYNFIKI